uniref:GRAM domain-containing protein n=1 Tax=Myripristis murdjan TaxID=586833 RepID=A0A667X3K4_9TELE
LQIGKTLCKYCCTFTNAQYHKLFKEVSKDELLKQSYTCALQKDILYQGKMFVSDNWICFHSKVFGRDTKIAIPVISVTLIKKTKTAILVPNALVIATTSERHVFVSFLSRDTTYKLLKSICIHLDVSADFSGDFSDLDGVVHQRRQDMMESSSSGSQTPDYDKMAGVCSILLSVLVLSSCYMAFKIVALEQRLNSLVSMGEYVRNESQDDFNAEIYGELSTNLFKLEKVCPVVIMNSHCFNTQRHVSAVTFFFFSV